MADTTATTDPEQRSRFPFRLWIALAIAALVIAVGLSAAWPIWRRSVLAADLEAQGARVGTQHVRLPSSVEYWVELEFLERWIRRITSVHYPSSEDVDPDMIERLDDVGELGSLEISGPRIGDEHMANVAHLTRLTLLGLQRTRVGDRGMEELVPILPQMSRLYLKESAITDEGLAHLAHCNKLVELRLDHNAITGTGFQHMRGGGPPVLTLSDSAVTDEGLRHVAQLRRLKHLELSRTQITDEGLRHLLALQNLLILDLQGTRITDAGLMVLTGMPPSEFHAERPSKELFINVSDTSVTRDGVIAFLERRPDVTVRFQGNAYQGEVSWKHGPNADQPRVLP